MWCLIEYKKQRLGITMTAVRIKNKLQLPSRLSTTKPLLEATKVLPATLREAMSAYWVALNARLHNSEINATMATVLQAPVKPSTITVMAKRDVEGPVCAISANSKLDAAMATPAIINPR